MNFGRVWYNRVRRGRLLRGAIAALLAVTTIVFSISIIRQSGQEMELQEQIRKLNAEVQQKEAENQDLRAELEEAHVTIETLNAAIENETEPEPEPLPEKRAYLTFDDGPHENTDTVLDILNSYGVKATFFVNGRESDANIATYKRIAEEGHILANHTYSHNYEEIYASVEAFMNDIYKLEDMVQEKAGVTMSKIVRFPGGSNNLIGEPEVRRSIKATLEQQGYRYFDWNVSGEDAVRENVTAKEIYDEVLRTMKGKETPVILLHSASMAEGTIEALPDILDYYMEQGYVFCTLDDENAPEIVLASLDE